MTKSARVIEKGAIVDLKDNDSKTPLLRAAQMGHEAVVKVLIVMRTLKCFELASHNLSIVCVTASDSKGNLKIERAFQLPSRKGQFMIFALFSCLMSSP